MREKLARIIYAATAIAVVVGISLTLWNNIHADTLVHVAGAAHDPTEYASVFGKVVSEFFYFTIWSNLLIGLTCALLALNPHRDGRVFQVLRLTSLVMIFVTGIVFNTVLLGTFLLPNAAAQWGCNIEHVIVPLLALGGWLLAGPRIPFRRGILLGSLIIPTCWIVFTFINGLIPVAGQSNDFFYPYPFIDVTQIGYGTALLNVAVVIALYIGLAAAVLGLDKVLPGRGARTSALPMRSEVAADAADRRSGDTEQSMLSNTSE